MQPGFMFGSGRLTGASGAGGRGHRHPRTVVGLGALIVVLALVGAACGGGRSSSGGSDGQASTTTAATTGVPQFGDLASPCGPGSPSGTPDQAVDASSITIGYGDDAGYQGSPGQNHQTSDAVKALIKWCNDQGGINGRTVKGNYYDAKITEVTNVMTEACTQTFMLVGQGFSLGGSGEATRLGCGLPSVPAMVVGTEMGNAPLQVAPVPQPVDYFVVAGPALLAQQYPEQVKKAAIMEPNFPSVISYTQRFERTVPTVGWQFLDCTQSYPITGVSDYRPYVQRVKDCGAQVVFLTDVGTSLQNIFDAANQLDFHPIWVNSTSVYTDLLAKSNTNGNADNLYFANPMVPVFLDEPGSANATYRKLVLDNGGDLSFSGQEAASAFLLWATAAKACGNELTRACVMDKLSQVHDWTAGGLNSSQDPGANLPGSCQLEMRLTGTNFEQWQPEKAGEFACDPAWVVKVAPPIDGYDKLGIGADRVARGTGA